MIEIAISKKAGFLPAAAGCRRSCRREILTGRSETAACHRRRGFRDRRRGVQDRAEKCHARKALAWSLIAAPVESPDSSAVSRD